MPATQTYHDRVNIRLEGSNLVSTYTSTEQVVLQYFFTNIDSVVYAATSAMPSELWANLAGGASRSDLDLRDRFLKIFREVTETEDAYAACMDSMAASIAGMDLSELKPVMEKATAFMSKWSVTYGHSSLKDSCVDRIIVDRVSIRVAKLLEETTLGAFQEKSTRYMDFSKACTVLPCAAPDRDLMDASVALLSESSVIYDKMTQACISHYMNTLPSSEFKDEAAKRRTATAKAFDTARYCLLVSKPTALAFTIPSRETERHVARLLAHPNQEVHKIAELIKEEAQKINPSLITHVSPNEFHGQTVDMSDLLTITSKPGQVLNIGRHWSDEPRVELVSADTSLIGVAASVYLANQDQEFAASWEDIYEAIRSHDDSDDVALQIIERRLAKRGVHDELPREFGCGEFIYDIIIDYGAYRDLQRHRVGTQNVSSLNCANGYTTPELLRAPGFEELLAEYDEYMSNVALVHAQYRKFDPAAAEYWFALGHNVRFTYTCNFKQVAYVTELRSKPAGHICYRMVAISMFDQFVDALVGDHDVDPERFTNLFRIEREANTDRRAQENKAQVR